MIVSQPQASLLFGPDDATPMSVDESTVKRWHDAEEALRTAPKVWLGTVRADARPHTMPVLLVVVARQPCFTSRPGARKSRNLAANPGCTITVATDAMDLVVEGSARRVHDVTQQAAIAEAFGAKYGWELSLRDGSAYEDHLPGSPEYAFYAVSPARGYGYGPDGLTATRWRF